MNFEPNRHLSLGWFFGLALVLHASFLAVIWDGNFVPEKSSLTRSNPIEIESFPEAKRKTVVQTSKAEEQAEDKDPAEFAGEIRNRVKKQTQARLTGSFREGKTTGEKTEGDGVGGKVSSSKENEEEGEPILAPGGVEGPGISDLMILGRSPHQLSEKIEKGNQTILNTDKVLYASFINRIAEEVYQPWVGNIQEALNNIRSKGNKLDNNTYVTKLNVSMDKYGEITGIQILASCGVPSIDEAPKKAFWEVEPFPNPPIQLIEEDGFIRLNYEFHFEWKSSGFNIVPMTI
ncbi:MAG: TonB C-terminal domain-containing protein [Deltaproteobacteria bacterium]|nr:TonB C-terminal domain-containing protein [Deltaproteobacteria bacterium]